MMSGENGRRVTIGLLQYVQKQSQYVSSKHIMPMLSHTPRQ